MQIVKPLKAHVGAVYDVSGTRFRHEQVQHVDVMELAVRDVDNIGTFRYYPVWEPDGYGNLPS